MHGSLCRGLAGTVGRVTDEKSIIFTSKFYESLCTGATVREAFETGLLELDSQEQALYLLLPRDDPHDARLFADILPG